MPEEPVDPSTEQSPWSAGERDRLDVANRLFFRLYQCANLLHKTGTRAVESFNLTTQRWAVLGALSRPEVSEGMAVGELARYLKVSRQSLSGVIEPLEADGLVRAAADVTDRRSRRLQITSRGEQRWRDDLRPLIDAYYDDVTSDIATDALTATLNTLVKVIDNMDRLDEPST